ncbi:MAG: N-acyl homoserine lactone hydrolase [Thermoleophilaceae bacterium]|jgi:glyoxylase-like metal-dependent hydrolase (beta-lactamase superfamily II)|nr:N-acyl homoserine lactone hydrolase [Thermoleophilaceae bacterium]
MKVELFNVGWFTSPAGLFRAGEPMDEPARYPVPAYLIETATERILVDTGLHPSAVADPEAFYGQPLGPFELEQELSIADQIDLTTLTKVVLTHLHFDHAGALALVPADVPLVVQRAEWEAGRDKAAIERNFFLPSSYAGTDRQVELVEGDHDLLGDGSIRLLLTPGHTPGHQSVQVGDLVIGGDVVHFAQGLDDHRFPLFGDDLEAQGRSAERLKAMRDSGSRVLPGHDAGVLRPGPLELSPAR